MKKHILGLLLLFFFLFLGIKGLNKLDETVKMPFIDNFKKEVVDENVILAEQFDLFVNSIKTPITLEEESVIIEAQEKYDNLPLEAQEKVKTFEKLQDYKNQIQVLKDKQAALEVIEMINALDNNYNEKAIKAARDAYEKLTLQQKELVTNLFILEENEVRLIKMVTNTNLNVGDIVTFKGGNVYYSSTSKSPTHNRPESRCKVTRVARNAKHPYHLVSLDGKRVYGWVDVKDIEKE
ncbi:MAG TPA: hypothetical protein PLT36_02015 [Erysipelotrichaceae bacterium]|jgi:hypothetical protein|nr:hypothetical protein [Erysipelotrichia bacterium]HPX32261.1 hypothetical protein [Erysipelotrichaceae bacterium]HQA84772.1 hypothetical protein [Erysipelotrichaceae bacterium]